LTSGWTACCHAECCVSSVAHRPRLKRLGRAPGRANCSVHSQPASSNPSRNDIMPPRRRPSSSDFAVRSTLLHPQQYLQPFLHYLEAECGMSRNTVSAYRVDISQFIEWFDAERIG